MKVAFGLSRGFNMVRFFGFNCRFRRLPAHKPIIAQHRLAGGRAYSKEAQAIVLGTD
jgi:hypothetical protein